MTITRTQMYAPASEQEFEEGFGLSVRMARDWARQISNMKSYACAPMLIPNNTFGGPLAIAGDSSTGIERFVCRWCPVPFPATFTEIRVYINARNQAGGMKMRYKLYADTRMYAAVQPVAASTHFTSDAKSVTIDITDGTNDQWVGGTITGYEAGLTTLDGSDYGEREVHLTLTKSPILAATDNGFLINVVAWAMPTVD